MLCEECGEGCEKCGKLVCREHIRETRTSHRRLCKACYEEREAKKAARRHHHRQDPAESTSFQALGGAEGYAPEAAAGEEGAEAPEEPEALVASRFEPPPPWRVSLYAGLLGLAGVLALLFFPVWRSIPLGGDAYLPIPVLMLVVPLFALFWAVYGYVFFEDGFRDRRKCWIGAGLGLVTVVLAVWSAFNDPIDDLREQAVASKEARDRLSAEEYAQWREDFRREALNGEDR
jgi:hypothetical protein